jgi:hypothetical protein
MQKSLTISWACDKASQNIVCFQPFLFLNQLCRCFISLCYLFKNKRIFSLEKHLCETLFSFRTKNSEFVPRAGSLYRNIRHRRLLTPRKEKIFSLSNQFLKKFLSIICSAQWASNLAGVKMIDRSQDPNLKRSSCYWISIQKDFQHIFKFVLTVFIEWNVLEKFLLQI